MGFRINRRIKIAKGLSLNLGKKGMSMSAKVGNTTLNSRGRMTTRLAPGVSYTTNLKSKNRCPAATKKNPNQQLCQSQQQIKEKNKVVAILLCIFLGYLGAHKFYEGKVLLGVLYIFTFGLCGIGIVVDLINLVKRTNPYYI